MQVKLDDEVLYEITESQLQLLAHDLVDPISEIKRRLNYIVEHKCDQCYERLEKEWLPILRDDPNVSSIPKSKVDFIAAVVSRPDYKNRAARDPIL